MNSAIWSTEDDPANAVLRQRLIDFYEHHSDDYAAFQNVSRHEFFWNAIAARARGMSERGVPRILEFGAGRSGFPEFIRKQGIECELVAQDVTTRNREFLEAAGARFHYGDIASIEETFDIIFSTFVWEHVAQPRKVLGEIERLLAPQGSIFLLSPRYDVLGYVPPVIRHLPVMQQYIISVRLFLSRALTLAGLAGPQFLVVNNPAVLNVDKWFIDADAVHLVSRSDILRYCRMHGLSCRDVFPSYASPVRLRDRLTKLAVELRREAGVAPGPYRRVAES